jgi:hypothetical protein
MVLYPGQSGLVEAGSGRSFPGRLMATPAQTVFLSPVRQTRKREGRVSEATRQKSPPTYSQGKSVYPKGGAYSYPEGPGASALPRSRACSVVSLECGHG